MPGLSQAELDAICICHDGPDDEPPSPIGTALLNRKRQRQVAGLKPQTESKDMPTLGDIAGAESSFGLSQEALDELSVPEPPTEDPTPSSPIGAALRDIKNRRRWGVPSVLEQQKVEIMVTPPVEAAAPALPCPSSWQSSGTGISQAELDALCGGEPEASAEEVQSPVRQTSPGQSSAKSPLRNSPAQPPQLQSPCRSPPMRRRKAHGYKPDAENLLSPAKGMDMASPGSPEILSPQRRSPAWRATPLSPVKLN